MKFRRKSAAADEADEATPADERPSARQEPARPAGGPFDVDDLPEDDVERVDLGSLLIEPEQGRELRLQVDEASGEVQSVVLAGKDGAIELRAFAAPRNGDLWSEVRPQIAADMAQTRRHRHRARGPLRPRARLPGAGQRKPRAATGTQPSRIIGINGPRWLLRATLLGRPAARGRHGRRLGGHDRAGRGPSRRPRDAGRRAAAADACPDAGAAGSPPTPRLEAMAEKSRLRRTISEWASSSDQHARDLRRSHLRRGRHRPIADAPDRELVRLRGTLRTVTLRPRGGVPALEAELDDGSGVITIVWLGRRRIAGIGPGRSIADAGPDRRCTTGTGSCTTRATS